MQLKSNAVMTMAQPAVAEVTLTELYDRWRETLNELMEMKWCGMDERMLERQRNIAARAHRAWSEAVTAALTPEWRAAVLEQRACNPGTEGPNG